jgi:phosphoribosylanthranilate isomerase
MADLPFVIKICGITNEEDAQAAVDAGANALGFNFYPRSPRYITPDRAQQIIAAVSGTYLRVGVFVNPSENEVIEARKTVNLDVVQLHGDHCPNSLSQRLRVWRSIAPTAAANDPNIEAYLLDTPSAEFGGSGETFDWRLAEAHTSRIILAGGLDSSNVAEAIRIANPWGVDACSRLESSPGKKSAQKVREFVRVAQLAVEQGSYTRVNL